MPSFFGCWQTVEMRNFNLWSGMQAHTNNFLSALRRLFLPPSVNSHAKSACEFTEGGRLCSLRWRKLPYRQALDFYFQICPIYKLDNSSARLCKSTLSLCWPESCTKSYVCLTWVGLIIWLPILDWSHVVPFLKGAAEVFDVWIADGGCDVFCCYVSVF